MDAVNRIADFFPPLAGAPRPAQDTCVPNRPARRPTKAKRERPRATAKGHMVPLVHKDGPFVFQLPAAFLNAHALPAATLVATFRQAFQAVWGRIPPTDRQRLLDYWAQPEPRLTGDRAAPPHRPVLKIVEDTPSTLPVCSNLGHELTFPAALLATQLARLPFEMARVLVQVHRYATRAHWALVVQMIELPLESWERKQRKKISTVVRDRKLDSLEAEYLCAWEAATTASLRSWGFEAPQPEIG